MAAPRSLTDLPPELLVEIISHYPCQFTYLSPLVRREHVAKRRERCQVLRTLSQCCSSLRRIFLPMLWERIEMDKPNFREQDTSSELATLVFPYIKSVHISMKFWSGSHKETIFLFVEFLRTLPNLTGLQIYHGLSWSIIPVVCYAFSTSSLPNITALSVPSSLDGVFPGFPNLTTLAPPAMLAPEVLYHSRLLPRVKEHCPRLDPLAGLRVDEILAGDFSHLCDFPHLRALSVANMFPVDAENLFKRLRAFPQLSELELLHQDKADVQLLPLEALIAGGRDTLRASQSKSVKVLKRDFEMTDVAPHSRTVILVSPDPAALHHLPRDLGRRHSFLKTFPFCGHGSQRRAAFGSHGSATDVSHPRSSLLLAISDEGGAHPLQFKWHAMIGRPVRSPYIYWMTPHKDMHPAPLPRVGGALQVLGAYLWQCRTG
ncbi:hypothetical protein B0H19DRAFT_1240738 [Mycena capillaripes]|nr:hypothetical protein B0H19DRAFT_1240738 [Mycena capillaripes]